MAVLVSSFIFLFYFYFVEQAVLLRIVSGMSVEHTYKSFSNIARGGISGHKKD